MSPLPLWLEQQGAFIYSSQPLFTLLFSLLLLLLLVFRINKLRSKKLNNLPPSPRKLPFIGNLHQLSSLPHRSLRSLAQKHGPLMLLHLGQVPTLVVSSANVAREILKTHDIVFSSRPDSRIPKRLLYGKDIAFAPYGEYWRQVRRICILQLLSAKRVQSFQPVRENEVALMVEKIEQISSTTTLINLSEMLLSFTNNIICRVAVGRKHGVKENEGELREMMKEFGYLLGIFDIGNLIPSLSWVNCFNGLNARVEKLFRKLDSFFDQVVVEHIEKRKKKKMGGGGGGRSSYGDEEDLVDVLLEIQEDGTSDVKLGKDNIKAIILDMFIAGTDTVYAALEWTMAELIRHPEVMKEVQEEIRRITKGKLMATEEDIEKMHYLKSVIKETLRLHPPIPLLVPRESTENVKIQGYDIQAKTTVIINAWAIGRDPSLWEDPEDFRPSRFMDALTTVDFKGKDFQLIPFGAGRRGCPGIAFADAAIQLGLANLLKSFEWEMPNGMNRKDLDISEATGFGLHMKDNLVLAATPRYY